MSGLLGEVKHYIQVRIYAPLFQQLDKTFGSNRFTLLDIGCGPNSVSLYQKLFPAIAYYGVDFKNPRITTDHAKKMTRYYEIDLNTLDFATIPENHFDAIVLSHVLEHLENPEKVLLHLITKIKSAGMIFVEYPSAKSVYLPSAEIIPFVKGTLNFYDDKTHVTLVDTPRLVAAMEKNGFTLLLKKHRRSAVYVLLSPFILPWRFFKNNFTVKASDLWDFTDFAQLVYFVKKSGH